MSDGLEHRLYMRWQCPSTRPARTPGGWAELGDMYKYKFNNFLNNVV